MGLWSTVGDIADYTVPGVAFRHGFGGEGEFSSAQWNKKNALNPDDPRLTEAETLGKAAQQQAGGEAIGSNYGDYGLSHGRDAANVSQTPLERLTERRRNFYLGGSPTYAKAASENAINTGAGAASSLNQQAGQFSAQGNQVFNRQYGPEGPSGAQAMLRQGTNEAIGTQLALARSGRGMGESASALGAAGRNAVTLQAGAANNAALLKAQEAENYAQRRDAAQRANDQAALGFGSLSQGGLGQAGQMGLAGQGLGFQIQNADTAARQKYEDNLLQYYNIQKGGNLQQRQMDQQQQNAYIAAGGTAVNAFAEASDERIKKDIYKLSPIEAKKDRQELGSSGAFADPLAPSTQPAPWLQSYMAGNGTPNGAFPNVAPPAAAVPVPGTLAPARTTMISPNYQPPKSEFAQSLEGGTGTAPGVTNPWGPSQQATDPWEKYLVDRQKKEDQDRYDRESASAKKSGIAAMGGVIGLGGLLAMLAGGGKLSDETTKHRKRPLGRRAQDPMIDMPAVSGRGVIMSDEHSKKKISDLQDENGKLKDALGTTSSMGAAPAPSAADIERWYGGAPATAAAPPPDVRSALFPDYAAPSPGMSLDISGRTTANGPPPLTRQGRMQLGDAMDTGNEVFPTRQLIRGDNSYQNDLNEEQPTRNYYPDDVAVTVSDKNSKMEIESLRAKVAALGGEGALTSGDMAAARPDPYEQRALQAIKAAPGFSYQYKQPGAPGAAPGTHYGPMAQDLEKTPMGASTVVQAPNGTKMVDTGRLSLVNTAALHAQQQELDDLQRKLSTIKPAAQMPPGLAENPKLRASRNNTRLTPPGPYTSQGLSAGSGLPHNEGLKMRLLRNYLDENGGGNMPIPVIQDHFKKEYGTDLSPAEADRLQRLANSTWM